MDNYIGMTTLNGKNDSSAGHLTPSTSEHHLQHKSGGNNNNNNGANSSGSSSGAKKCRCCSRLTSLLCSNVGLSLLIVLYSTLGALLFSQLESLSERQRVTEVISLRNSTIAKLWRITENTNILKEENWTAMTTNEIIKFQQLLYQAFREGYDGREIANPKADQWSFTGAFLYSITVITTIGYGNIGPRTMEGKMLTIVYAILGIPLMVLFLSKMGSMLANGLRCFYRSCCTCLPSPGHRSTMVAGHGAGHLASSGTLDALDPLHLSPSGGLLSHHAHHSHHHLHDHYHVHHISLNELQNNVAPSHVALHCNSTSSTNPGTGTLGIVCKGSAHPAGTTCCGNALTLTGSGTGPGGGGGGGGGGLTLSPTIVSMGNSIGQLGVGQCTGGGGGGGGIDSETKLCPETEVPEHYTTCGGILLNRHSHATLLRGDTLHTHHGDHINATLTACSGDHNGDYRYQDSTTTHQHGGGGGSTLAHHCNHHINPSSNNITECPNNNNNKIKSDDNSNLGINNYYPKTVPITLCCIIIAAYILLGASIFYLWEGWSYWESVYFCFASISTIGLGQATWILSEFRNSEKKLILCCLYILFGLALGAMVFNLLQDHVKRKLSSSSCSGGGGSKKSDPSNHHHDGHNCGHHLHHALVDREMCTSTPAPHNPLLGEDDFDV